MLKRCWLLSALIITIGVTGSAQGPRRIPVGDWPEMRGPNRDGISRETGLIDTLALNGENFLWRVPYGGRSAPIVMGNRVYVQNPAGRGTNLQERVMALDADTRQGDLGIQVQPVSKRRAAAPRSAGPRRQPTPKRATSTP